jgi:hypothetical protein
MCTGSEKKRSAWDTTRYLVPQPMWLMGLVCMGGTLVFTALADVQPILVIELIFTLALRAGLFGFLAVVNSSRGSPEPHADRLNCGPGAP